MKDTWYGKYAEVYGKPYSDEYKGIAEGIKAKILKMQSSSPVATLVVISYNEGENLLSCLWALSNLVCDKYPIEIIGVDNDSQDNSVQIFKDCGIEPYIVKDYHTCGATRQKGLDIARGKYFFCIDGDTLYPPLYVQTMVERMENDPAIAAVGTYWDFLPDPSYSRFELRLYEFFRDCHLFFQEIKRPELAIRGMTMAFVTELGRKFGFRVDLMRVDDGTLILNLKTVGKIKFFHSKNTTVVTGTRTILQEGSLFKAFMSRVKLHLKNSYEYFSSANHYEDKEK